MLGGGTMIGAASWSVGYANSYEESLIVPGWVSPSAQVWPRINFRQTTSFLSRIRRRTAGGRGF